MARNNTPDKKPVVIQAQPAVLGVAAMPAKASGSITATGSISAQGETPVVPSVRKAATPPESFGLLRWRRPDDDSRWEYRLVGSDGELLGLGIDKNRLKALIGALKSLPPPESQ